MRTVLITLVLIIGAYAASAQTVEFSGQFRERSELNEKSFNEGTHRDVYHLLRTRLQAVGTVSDQVRVVFEVQDARVFGEESSTFNSGAPHLDLRQGFVQVDGLADGHISATLGRQALVYANQRFIGAIDWHNYGQTFDAGVLRLQRGDFRIDALGAAVRRNPAAPAYTRDVFLAGAWAAWSPEEARQSVQLFFLYDNPADGSTRQNRQTAGVYAGGHLGMFDYEVDAALQMGDYLPDGSAARDIAANMVGLRAGYRLPFAGARIGVGYDRLSGTDPESENYGAFHTLYATNHKYYGFMDYFLNIPAATGGLGLQDILVQLSVQPMDGFSLGADLHLFSTVIDPATLSSAPPEAATAIGTEIDVTAKWTVAEVVGMTAGVSFFSGDENRVALTGSDDSATWLYLMTTVTI
jgi:hypothetical protein